MIIKQKQKIEKKNLKIKSCCPKIWSFLEEKQEMQACKRLENRKREQWRMVMCCHEFIFLLYIFPSLTKRKTSLSEISLPLVIFKICLEKIMGSLLLATAWWVGWARWLPEAPPNLNHSVSLWKCFFRSYFFTHHEITYYTCLAIFSI